jgi:hypothetical protein
LQSASMFFTKSEGHQWPANRNSLAATPIFK